jgi:hypothetical protein
MDGYGRSWDDDIREKDPIFFSIIIGQSIMPCLYFGVFSLVEEIVDAVMVRAPLERAPP